jgi:hypothetical protein
MTLQRCGTGGRDARAPNEVASKSAQILVIFRRDRLTP